MKPNRRVLACLGLLVSSTTVGAAIVVSPTNPSSFQAVTIRLTNQYFSAASVASATIARNGSQFTITQTVNVTCALPTAPVLTSDFDVGTLPAGTYQVTAQIHHIGFGPGCTPLDQTQTASFSVNELPAVPMESPWIYFLIASLLLATGACEINRRHES